MNKNTKLAIAVLAVGVPMLAIVVGLHQDVPPVEPPPAVQVATSSPAPVRTAATTSTAPKVRIRFIDMKPMAGPSGTYEGTLVSLTNQERTTPVVESQVLDSRALNRALAVCKIPFGESAHDSFYTDESRSRSILSDLSNGTAENLARNFEGDVAATHTAFMASPTHRRNIVNPIYQYMGVGHVTCGTNAYGNDEITVEFFTADPLYEAI